METPAISAVQNFSSNTFPAQGNDLYTGFYNSAMFAHGLEQTMGQAVSDLQAAFQRGQEAIKQAIDGES